MQMQVRNEMQLAGGQFSRPSANDSSRIETLVSLIHLLTSAMISPFSWNNQGSRAAYEALVARTYIRALDLGPWIVDLDSTSWISSPSMPSAHLVVSSHPLSFQYLFQYLVSLPSNTSITLLQGRNCLKFLNISISLCAEYEGVKWGGKMKKGASKIKMEMAMRKCEGRI